LRRRGRVVAAVRLRMDRRLSTRTADLHQTAKYGIVNWQEKYCFAPRHRLGGSNRRAVDNRRVVRSGWLRDRDLPAKGRRSAVQAFDRSMAWKQGRPDSKPKPLHMNRSLGASAPERREKEPSAPRPHAGRLVIFYHCAVRTKEGLNPAEVIALVWLREDRRRFDELVAGLAS